MEKWIVSKGDGMRVLRRLGWIGLLAMLAMRVMAQEALPPTIIEFASTVVSVRLTALESGSVNTVLSWHAVNMTDSMRLEMDEFLDNVWIPAALAIDPLPSSGSAPYAITHPRGFAPPTFRLRLLDGDQVVDERMLVIRYDSPSNMARFTASSTPDQFTREGLPRITHFELLPGGTTDAPIVGWEITDRAPYSNPIIEQVTTDGTVTVESPRDLLWLPSQGSMTLDRVTLTQDGIRLRLRVIDLVTGLIYDEAVISIAPDGSLPTPTPPSTATDVIPSGSLEMITRTPDAAAPTLPAPPPLPITPSPVPTLPPPEIIEFSAAPAEITPGGTTRLIWLVRSASAVEIQAYNENGDPGLLYIQLPLEGSLQITLTPAARSSRFVLIARNLSGETVERALEVHTTQSGG